MFFENFFIQDETGGPQSWPAFTESQVIAKSSYLERSQNPPSVDNAKLDDLTQANYQSKFGSLLYWEEERHIELLHQK